VVVAVAMSTQPSGSTQYDGQCIDSTIISVVTPSCTITSLRITWPMASARWARARLVDSKPVATGTSDRIAMTAGRCGSA
jgi:hypothetical protein